MAKSLRNVIESVLEEISLCGDRGASPAEVLGFIDAIYATPSQHRGERGTPPRSPKIDHPFKSRLWTWLTRHPEVSVGKNKEGNCLTLEEIFVEDSELATLPKEVKSAEKATGSQADTRGELRVFVSQERMWRAITGHEPDNARILPLEFALLSIIASFKSRGIIQGDLVRISGQDKRSVPKRTDLLQQKGYIEKKAIQYKGARTSLCTFQKFAGSGPAEISQSARPENERVGNAQQDDMIDFSVLLDKLFLCLRERKVITRNELKIELGMTELWRSKVLRRAIRKLEAIGCVRRVQAVSQYFEITQSSHPCVMLIREPTEKDIRLFHEDSSAVIAILQQDSIENLDDAQAQDEDREDITTPDTFRSSHGQKDTVQDAGRIIPQWTPDQSLPHLLFKLVDKAGSSGMDNLEIAAASMGIFFRRPIEALLARLVDSWQYTQPLHLRHLSLIRDTALRGTISYFIQYSFRNFAALVKDGQASWEAVETPIKKSVGRPAPISAKPKLDEHGFVIGNGPPLLLRQGNATLREGLEVAKPSDYVISFRDPIAVHLRDGSLGIRFENQLQTQKTVGRLRSVGFPASHDYHGERQCGTKRSRSDAGFSQGPEMIDEVPLTIHRRTIKRRKKKELSELEQLKAKGYDESWVVYNALTLQKPTPGLYLTPVGKRRALGMKQGRAGKGRIAIFKLPRLKEFDWFVETTPAPETAGSRVAQLAQVTQHRETITPHAPNSSRRRSGRLSENKLLPVLSETTSNSLTSPIQFTIHSNGEVSESSEVLPPDVKMAGTEISISEEASKKRKSLDVDNAATSECDAIAVLPGKRQRGRPPKKRRLIGQSLKDEAVPRASIDNSTSASSVPDEPQNVRNSDSDLQQQQEGQPSNLQLECPEQEPCQLKASPIAPSAQGVRDGVKGDDVSDFGSIARDRTEPVLTSASQTKQLRKTNIEPTPVQSDMFMGTANATGSTDQLSLIKNSQTLNQDDPFQVMPMDMDAIVSNGDNDISKSETQANTTSTFSGTSTRLIAPETLENLQPVTQTESEGGSKSKVTKKDTRGGSIAFQRRKIIMDIIQQCEGAHPLGTELWYPFATAWLKARTEKPDMRTIRTTVKSLVDAGKLRQLTFSGKNSKGLMVTKSLISRPEIDPMSSMIRNLQNAVLSADPEIYLHPKADIDPTLKKSHKGLAGLELKLPEVENEVRVDLSYMPAKVRRRQLHPRLPARYRFLVSSQSFDFRRPDFETSAGHGRVRKLRRFRIPSSTSPYLDSLSTPVPQSSTSNLSVGTSWLPKEVYTYDDLLFGAQWKPSLLSLLMCPPRIFNAATRTFGTGSYYTTKLKQNSKRRIAPPKQVVLPNELGDILSMSKACDLDLSNFSDPTSMRFFSEVDAVRDWELKSELHTVARSEDLRYISHTIPGPFESISLEGPVWFESDERPPPPPRRLEPPVTRQTTFRIAMEPLSTGSSPLSPHLVPQTGFGDRFPTQSNRRLMQLQGTTRLVHSTAKPGDRILKRVRHSKDFPQRVAEKLTMAIVVVRTLAGGLEGKLIDWALVASAFPGYDPQFIQDRGRNIIPRHRLQMARMQRDFQARYIEGYENNLVPKIDYNNLEGYDWEAVVNWAEEQLEGPSLMKVPNLPATHEQFASVFDIRKEPVLDINELYQHNAQTTMPRKRTLHANIPSAALARQKPVHTVMTLDKWKRVEQSERLDIAKTWVRANVITPEETYRPTEARRLLERFGEDLIGQAIQSLITERVISMSNRGKITPGRNYDVTEYFLHEFSRKRAIESKQLKRAIHFKLNVLDPAFQSAGKYELPYEAEDGDILVLIDLLAAGRVTMCPVNPPRNKYGLTDQGYLTRRMDKTKLRFTVEIRPVAERYVYGNPLAEIVAETPVPTAGLNEEVLDSLDTLPRIPLWIDVHGNFVKLLWEIFVAAVLGLIVVQPGAGAETIGRVLQPHVGAWEVELILQWLDAVGAIRCVREDGGKRSWMVKEWWYLVLCS
ncbi:hypothetical protein PRK78_006726 [Emydomyces testavorans]|uniref:TFIIIC transcription initiation factor complex subunits Tfc3 n=1 Tax=Emydomyces testavorans TaxID=2070801 RepID=A0AAF0DPR9_9EURO|nr:hypothetical protein PRK78_006726 [Emydomyces testavorans]